MVEESIDELKAAYKVDKAKAVQERIELEVMRTAFAAQCDKVSSMEARVGTLKSLILNKIMEREGLEP